MDKAADPERQLGILTGIGESLRLAHGALEAEHATLVQVYERFLARHGQLEPPWRAGGRDFDESTSEYRRLASF